MKEIADFSITEIANILDLQEATVKTRVHRGRLQLRKAIAEALPSRGADPPDHSASICLDLLQTKQDALDKGVPFPLPPSELCSRCRSLLATMDLVHDVCVDIGRGEIPKQLRERIRDRLGNAPQKLSTMRSGAVHRAGRDGQWDVGATWPPPDVLAWGLP